MAKQTRLKLTVGCVAGATPSKHKTGQFIPRTRTDLEQKNETILIETRQNYGVWLLGEAEPWKGHSQHVLGMS